MNENVVDDPSGGGEGRAEGLSRRTIVRGAAWSVPVIATTVAMPMATASTPCTQTTVSRTTAGQQPFVVPAGVTSLTFEVSGAPGGGSQGLRPLYGGSGALVTGTLVVTPGDTLTLWAAEGGFMDPLTTGTVNAGGAGWARGGAATDAGSGGGASAVLLNGAPVVVAGGGGGGGSSSAGYWAGQVLDTYVDYPFHSGGDGGNAAAPFPTGRQDSTFDYKATALPGQPGTATGPGAGGEGGLWEGSNPATPPASWATIPGNAGNGSTGGAGVMISAGNPGLYARSSGGGGDGWFGGGSGGAARYVIDANNMAAFGSGGGGGSGWTDPARVVVTAEGTGVPATPSSTRVPGYVTIHYCAPGQ